MKLLLRQSFHKEQNKLATVVVMESELFFSVALRPNAGHGLLILEVSRSHTTTHHIW
jgi:hypothetical protein